ncbi:MAG: hypothetical protein JWN99_1229 [Ilumatobacteraceae bacterium]|nr:hypothetical protein [Ilumatobacteraceae bacterium]
MDEPLGITLDELIAVVVRRHPSDDALGRVSAAVHTSSELGELSDHLVGHFVDEARRAGATWTEIGQSMGVTKQAVQKRFVTNAFAVGQLGGDRFGRFTQRARHVVVMAEQHARTARHSHVTPDHVLLGLLDETEALAARAIVAQRIALDDVRARVVALHPPSTSGAPADAAHIPFDGASKQLFERCLRAALLLGHNYIGTEHMLLAMLDDVDTDAARVLGEAGVDSVETQRWILEQLGAVG